LILAVLILTSLPTPALAWPSPRGNPSLEQDSLTLRIRFHNYANVAEERVKEGFLRVNRIYREVGIEFDWINCVALPHRPAPAICASPAGPSQIDLILLPRAGAVHGVSRRTVGITIWQAGQDGPPTAYVFYDRVVDLASQRGHPPRGLLGHALAHEIGHVLLGTPEHSHHGLMRKEWSVEDLRRANQSFLPFTPEIAARLREERRSRLARTEQVQADRPLQSLLPSRPERWLLSP
jgi:hypothetical protein